MAEANKNTEKAGAKASASAPVDSSKVEGTQPAASTNDLIAENDGLKSELQSKNDLLQARAADVQTLEMEKDALETENGSLKAKVVDLEKKLEASKSSSKKSKAAKRFVVTSSFRSKTEGEEGKIYNINDDVTDFDADRLKNLVERDLVKEI